MNEDANEDTFTLLAATGNAWYDIDTGSAWTLYFGGGFGTANLGIHLVDIDVEDELDDPDYTFSTWSLAFQAGAGIGYTIADFMVIDLGYRLLGSIDPKLVKSGSIDGKGNSIGRSSRGRCSPTASALACASSSCSARKPSRRVAPRCEI